MPLNELNNVLIIRLSSLGDILLTTPLIRSLKKKYPLVSIDFIMREEYRDVLKHNTYINNLMLFSRTDNTEIHKTVKNRNYDMVIDLQNNLRSRSLTRQVSAPVYKLDKKRLDKFLLVNFGINRLMDAPPVPERYIAAVPELEPDGQGLDLILPDNINTVSSPGRNIAMCPGSRHFTKMWPEVNFIELGRLLSMQGYKIFLLGGSSDREICRRIAQEIDGAADLSNNNELFLTAAEMKNCTAIICNDSGMMHTACAAGVPVAVFFGSTVREFGFTPYKNNNLILENNSLSCRPCSHIGRAKCPKGHFKCMKEITPALAFDKISKILK
ncbi:MAG: glycosyltransferase family 9 protein [Syntrophothermus sp.]